MAVDFAADEKAEIRTEGIDNPHDFTLAVAHAKMNDIERLTVTRKMFDFICKDVGESPGVMYQGVLVEPVDLKR